MKSIPQTYRGSSSGVRKRKKPVVDIILQNGYISDIVDIPDGVTIRVWDYDVQGMDTKELHVSPYDEDKLAQITYWE